MKTPNEIVKEIIENGRAADNIALENEFEFSTSEEGYSDEQIQDALKSSWFPWFKNPAAVALGRLGGSVRGGIKAEKSAANGRKGGRPKKKTE